MKLFYNPSGTVKVLPVSVLPVNAVWNGGFPYTPEGSLLVSIVSAKPTDTVSNGGFIQELWGGVCAGYDTPSVWIGGLAVTSYGALCLDVDGGIVTDGPVLYNSLTHSLIPTRGDITPSFTRASTATFTDWEGVQRTVPSGCARFEGARMVRNWIQAPTENLSSAGWVKSGISVSGNRLTATGANGTIYDNAALGMGTGRTAVGSVTLSRVTGTGNVDISTNGGTTWTTVSVTGARVSVSLTGNINGQFAIRIVTSGDAVDATYPQLEDVTGQTTQTASEYVSVGVASAPAYHGSMVDGVKCYDTDRSGNPISTTGSYPLVGYVPWEARTNLLLQSAVVATQSITVAAVAHTLSFKGTGTITLSGVSVAGPLVGTGANDRVTLTFTPTAGSLTLTVSGSCTVGQLEAGSFATPYIPTTTVAVARDADLLTYTGADVALLKTLACQFAYPAVVNAATNYTILDLDDGDYSTNSVVMRVLGDQLKLQTFTYFGTVAQSSSTHTNALSGTNHKCAITWPTNGIISDVDGGDFKTDAVNTPPVGLTTLRVGNNSTGSQHNNGPVNHIYGWTRNLSQSELGAIDA